MREPRVFVDLPLSATDRLTLPADASAHLVRVLRLRVGDPLVLFDGRGRDYPARLIGAAPSAATVEVGEPGEPEPQAPLAIHLAIGVSKGERMDFAIQKAVELGVARVTPLFTERAVVRLSAERLAKRDQHWRGVVIAACEQSGRRCLPVLDRATSLGEWLAIGQINAVVLHHRATRSLPELPAPAGELTLLIGPEGGLAEREREQAVAAGFTAVRLGPRVLRTETAPLAAIAAAQVLWGDFGN